MKRVRGTLDDEPRRKTVPLMPDLSKVDWAIGPPGSSEIHMPKGPGFPEQGVVGIDPGASGGIAYVWIAPNGRVQAWAKPMPETWMDIWGVIRALGKVAQFAIIERVNAMPKQGVVSTFKFGKSAGALEMALVAAGLRYELVTPSVWQGNLHCRTGGVKNVSKARAQQLFPGVKMTHAIADALLIAEYGRRNPI